MPRLTAQQFFDVWSAATVALRHARVYDDLAFARQVLFDSATLQHGEAVAQEALVYFERLRADTRSGISSYPPSRSAPRR